MRTKLKWNRHLEKQSSSYKSRTTGHVSGLHWHVGKTKQGVKKSLSDDQQAPSVWQSEDKQSASLKALSKSVCMPFRALAWPKCQSNIWQKHITLFHSPSLHLTGSFLIPTATVVLQKG